MNEWLDLPDLIDKMHDLMDIGLYDDVIETLDTYASVYPAEPEMFLCYARAYSEQDKPKEALPHLMECRKIEPNNIDCLLGIFYAHTQLDDMKSAVPFLEEATAIAPENELVASSWIWYYNETGSFTKAIVWFEKARALHTNNPDTFRNAGIAFMRLNRYEESEACFITSLTLNPQFDEARDLLADLYILQDDIEKSIQVYHDHLVASPNNIRTLSRLAFCLSQAGDYPEALSVCNKTISLYPNSPVGYVDSAYVHLSQGLLEQAMASVNKALDASPLDPESFRVKAIVLSELMQDEEADQVFKKALELDPENSEIKRDYYHHLRSTKDYDRMEQTVAEVIKDEHPYCMEEYWFLADHYRDMGQDLKAFSYLRKAIKLMPDEAELLPPMADILLEQGHKKLALPILAKYVEKSGWNDIMDQFARHKRLTAPRMQEGLRLLRFFGERPAQFRDWVYHFYIAKYIKGALLFLSVIFLMGSFILLGLKGLLITAIICGSVALGWFIYHRVKMHRLEQSLANDDPVSVSPR